MMIDNVIETFCKIVFMEIYVCRQCNGNVEKQMGCSIIMGFLAGHETWKSSGDNVDGCHHWERDRTSGASDGRMLRPLLPGGGGRSLIRAVRSLRIASNS